MGRSSLLGAASAAALLCLTVPAAAQDQSQPQPIPQAKPVEVSPAQSTGMEIVVVTARRRAENLEKVPVADTALSGETLRASNINSALALQNHVPSLTVSADLGSRDDDVFTLRGQSQPFGGADPGVQTYFAEVPFNAGGPGSEYDMDNVQVLKGPQGTLFGRNTTGGAILFEPKRPDDQFGGYLDATGGDYDLGEIKGAINIPLSDTLAIRIAGDAASRQGFTKDVSTGQDLDNLDYQAFRIGVTWRPFAGFENYAVFDYLRDRNHGTGAELTAIAPQSQLDQVAIGAFQAEGDPNAVADGTAAVAAFYPNLQFALANQQALGPRKTTSSIPLFFKRESWGATDIATYDVAPHLHLENIFGFRGDKEQPAFDYDGSFLPILDIPNARTWESNGLQVTDEFQVKGETQDNTFNWIFGFYHELDHPGGYSEVERDTFGGGTVFPPLSSTEIDSLGNGGTSNAVYGSATYDASSWAHGLSFTAGGRYTWDHKVATDRTCILPEMGTSCPFPLPDTAPYAQPTQQASFRAPTWTLSAQDQVTDDTMVYATYRRGYKSGGFNSGASAATDLEEFKPEFLTDVELGTKNNWTLLGMPGRTNFDVYYGWYSNIQKNDLVEVEQEFLQPPPNPPLVVATPAALTFNAARATVKGLEFESTFIPSRFLDVSLFYSYTDATYSKFVLPQAIFIDPLGNETAIGPLDHSGNPFAYTPKNKFGITPSFHIPMDPALGEATLSATYYWQSKVWFSDLSDLEPDASQKSYGLLNLRVDWNNFLGQAVDLSAFVDNVTNKTYKQGADALLHLTGTSASIYGPPRMWGLELRYRFGEDAASGN